MAMSYHFQDILLRHIDLQDHPFTGFVPAEFDILKASLSEVGLLSPPWLRRRADGLWQVVAGLKRLQAALALNWQKVLAFTLADNSPDSLCLLISLYDNACRRSLSPLEQAHYAARLLAHYDRSTVIQRFLPLLGLPAAAVYLDRLLALASLEEPLQLLVQQGRLALPAAARLAAWQPQDRLAAVPFFQLLPLSQSKQEELLAGLALLARREGGNPRDFLIREEFQRLLGNPALNPQDKAQAVRRQLRLWLQPRLSAAEASFTSLLKRLGLKQHPRRRLYPPPAFEGPDFYLELAFRDAAELEQHLTELLCLIKTQAFKDLMSL